MQRKFQIRGKCQALGRTRIRPKRLATMMCRASRFEIFACFKRPLQLQVQGAGSLGSSLLTARTSDPSLTKAAGWLAIRMGTVDNR